MSEIPAPLINFNDLPSHINADPGLGGSREIITIGNFTLGQLQEKVTRPDGSVEQLYTDIVDQVDDHYGKGTTLVTYAPQDPELTKQNRATKDPAEHVVSLNILLHR